LAITATYCRSKTNKKKEIKDDDEEDWSVRKGKGMKKFLRLQLEWLFIKSPKRVDFSFLSKYMNQLHDAREVLIYLGLASHSFSLKVCWVFFFRKYSIFLKFTLVLF